MPARAAGRCLLPRSCVFRGFGMTYSEKLKDPRWQKKRLQILERDNWRCVNCTDSESQLHVHHKQYESKKMPWDYDDSNFITLCKECHDEVTAMGKRVLSLLHNERYFVAFWGLFQILDRSDHGFDAIRRLYFHPKTVEELAALHRKEREAAIKLAKQNLGNL